MNKAWRVPDCLAHILEAIERSQSGVTMKPITVKSL